MATAGQDRADMHKAEKELKDAFEKYGVQGIKLHFEKKLAQWKDVPLYVGVTGRSGVGKSSFINALRGLEAEDEGAAEIGVTETTTTVEQYPHPQNKQLILCDLPGVGTPTFSKATYFTDKRIGFDKFDMFLILTCDRFMEDDLWLAKGIEERNKTFLFIRTKIDQDVENEKRARKALYKKNPEAIRDVIQKIRDNCEENLRGMFSSDGRQRVFLIDSYEIENPLYDFDRLTVQLIENFPALKRDAFILSLSSMTPNIIEAKEKVLRDRIPGQCLLSAVGGAIPVPGVSLAIDAGIVLKEAQFYREQLGLEEKRLRQAAENVQMPWEVFKETVDLKSLAITYTKAGILQFCSFLVVSEGVEKSVAYAIPIIGSIIGATISYGSTKYTLETLLDMMVADAKRVNECITKKAVSTMV